MLQTVVYSTSRIAKGREYFFRLSYQQESAGSSTQTINKDLKYELMHTTACNKTHAIVIGSIRHLNA